MALTWSVIVPAITVLFVSVLPGSEGDCLFPEYLQSDWFYMADQSVQIRVDATKWGNRYCDQIYTHDKPVPGTAGANNTILLKDDKGCKYCLDVLWRTIHVLQFREDKTCMRGERNVSDCPGVKLLPDANQVHTMFRASQEVKDSNCISTFEGMFQFTYQIKNEGGICDNPDSQIRACQDPGSKYVDNHVFMMQFAKCPSVGSSYNKQKRYNCYGTWFAVKNGTGYTYAVISDTVEKDNRERFKCLLTNKNQKEAWNKVRWVMSRFAMCSNLNTITDGPVKLVLTRIAPSTTYLTPQCILPRNVTGTWLTQGVQYQSNIRINETHIYFFTSINEFEYQETYYSCQQSQGSRYLMTKVVIGRCEIDFVCFDITARRHSIVRYRVGKPFQYKSTLMDTDPKSFLTTTFREACSWVSFTFNRDDYKWKYETMILNPPSPVPCPIAGRYSFVQNAMTPVQRFQTRIRGVTEKPRTQIQCRNWVTEFKSCSNTMTRIEIDAEYCESVDYRGRPIGEYDEPDNIMTCVGFWMEDMKSYLVTWDEEDAVSSYRCWVFERKSWTGVYMSRAQNARCTPYQNAKSFNISGTGLSLDLTESERLFDDCPQRFDPGNDLHSKPITLWVLSGAPAQVSSLFLLLVAIVTAVFIR